MERAIKRGGEALRRTVISILMIAVMAIVAGCGESEGDRSVTVRYRTIIALKVDGKTREFSSVMQTQYTRITQSLLGAGGSVSDWGEAVVSISASGARPICWLVQWGRLENSAAITGTV
jgi:hypothetical protein